MSWRRDGCRTLAVGVAENVPTFDDPMIREVLVRAAGGCLRADALERALNRELWPIGYVARLEHNPADRAVIQVDISSCR